MYDVLIVDDSRVMREMIKMHLVDSNEGFSEDRIITTGDGASALKEAKEKKFDLVLTDFNMPEMNGEEFIRKLRELEHGKSAQVVLMTSQNLDEIKKKIANTGVKLFLHKPVTKETVNNFIFKVIQIEKAKAVIQEEFPKSSKAELIMKIIYQLAENLDFKELDIVEFIQKKEEFFSSHISSVLQEKFNLKEHRAELLANYFLEHNWDNIMDDFSECILIEIGSGDTQAEEFISLFNGSAKMIDKKRYILPSLTSSTGRDIKINQLHITAEQYFRQITKIKHSTEKISKIKSDLSNNLASEKAKNLKEELEKEKILLENLKKSYKEYQSRYALILDAIKNALSKDMILMK